MTYKSFIHSAELTLLQGPHIHLTKRNVTALFPGHYVLVSDFLLPDIALLSLAGIFKPLPLRLWPILNSILDKLLKGYWLLLKYKKTYDYDAVQK